MSQGYEDFMFRKVAEEMVTEEILKKEGKLKYTSLDLGLRNSPYMQMVNIQLPRAMGKTEVFTSRKHNGRKSKV